MPKDFWHERLFSNLRRPDCWWDKMDLVNSELVTSLFRPLLDLYMASFIIGSLNENTLYVWLMAQEQCNDWWMVTYARDVSTGTQLTQMIRQFSFVLCFFFLIIWNPSKAPATYPCREKVVDYYYRLWLSVPRPLFHPSVGPFVMLESCILEGVWLWGVGGVGW